jgi:hypothetical protein
MGTEASATILTDAISPEGKRLTVLKAVLARPYLAEFNTHRAFSRSSASSRAIPVSKQVASVMGDPYLPLDPAYNQPGMQAAEPLTPADRAEAERLILELRDRATETALALANLGPINPTTNKPLGLHKQWANRYIEPWMWHTVIVGATDWDGFFAQRTTRSSVGAQPEFRACADAIEAALEGSTPKLIDYGEWNTPLILPEEDFSLVDEIKISVARCARVSFLQHDGVRDPAKDVDMWDKLTLAKPMHVAPSEFVATPVSSHFPTRGNFDGWLQIRQPIEDFGPDGALDYAASRSTRLVAA